MEKWDQDKGHGDVGRHTVGHPMRSRRSNDSSSRIDTASQDRSKQGYTRLVASVWPPHSRHPDMGAAVLSRERRNLLRRRELHPLHDVWVNVNGHRLYARISKVDSRRMSAPVVLVHGWGVSGSYFIPLAERLAGSFDVYLPDLPGHGMRKRLPSHSM